MKKNWNEDQMFVVCLLMFENTLGGALSVLEACVHLRVMGANRHRQHRRAL